MGKSRILMIQTGGTIGQKRGADGVFRPSNEDYVNRVPNIHDLAEIVVKRTVNIDSTNMDTHQRVTLARTIYQDYRQYDGFVVVHGTDTMVDSAAALNYMLQHLGKPVVFTGSQKSIFEPGSDGHHNLYYAVKAATMDLGEIVIAFGDRIVRGNRAIKQSEHSLNAFNSPRIPPVAEIGIDIMLAPHRISRYNGEPVLFSQFDTNVDFYQQSSGTNTSLFDRSIKDNMVKGIVIGAYGAGNVQDRLIPSIEKATSLGKPILVVTNCQLGAADMGIYDVGAKPLKAGAISAGDMTMEAAIQKLMYALGKVEERGYKGFERIEYVCDLIHRSYAQDIGVTNTRFT